MRKWNRIRVRGHPPRRRKGPQHTRERPRGPRSPLCLRGPVTDATEAKHKKQVAEEGT